MDNNSQAVFVFNKMAKQYQDRFMYLDLYNDTFDLFCNSIKEKGASVLEIACGPGNITRYLLSKRPDLKILATDLAPNMILLARENNPGASFQIMDCRDIDKVNIKYNALMAGFCLPYLSKDAAIKLIGDASKLLDDKGVVYLSTMEDDYNKSGLQKGSSCDEIYIYYHQADYLLEALEENNFNIISIQRKDFKQADGSITKDLILLAGK